MEIRKLIIKSGIPAVIISVIIICSILSGGCTGKDYVPDGDIRIVKLDSSGHEEWNTTIDTGNDDRGTTLLQTPDGGYVILGENNPVLSGERIPCMIRLSETGAVLWNRSFPGDPAIPLLRTPEGGFVAAGTDRIFRLNETGEIVRETPLANSLFEHPRELSISWITLADDGMLSALGNLPGSDPEFLIVQLDGNGSVEGKKTYDLMKNQSAFSFIATRDGGYAVAGYATDTLTEKGTIVRVNVTGWVKKIDRNGTLTWERNPEGTGNYQSVRITRLSALRENPDGTIGLLYTVVRFGPDGPGTRNTMDVSFDAAGTRVSEKTLNASDPVTWAPGGGYVFAAFPTDQENVYSDLSYGGQNLHVIRLDPEGLVTRDTEFRVIRGTAASVIGTQDNGYAVLVTEEKEYS